MSDLELNKIVAAILLASLIAMLVGFVANILYKPNLNPGQRGYQVEVVEDTGQHNAAPKVELSIKELMAAANADAGARVAKKCTACHTLNNGGPHKVGPNLWKMIGAKKGARPDFPYSKVMLAADGKWDLDSLFAFLKKPGKYLPGTKMSFAGIKKPQDIANLIAYLSQQTQ